MDVYIALAMNEPPLLRLKYPSVAEAEAQIAACNDGSMPLEPYQLISQYTLEPLLKAEAEQLPTVVRAVRLRVPVLLAGCRRQPRPASATQPARSQAFARSIIVGCDGGASAVRKQLGIQLRGEGNLLRLYQALYYCPDLFDMIPIGPGPGKGRHYHIADDAIDVPDHAGLNEALDAARRRGAGKDQMAAQFERTVGVPVRYEMLYVGEWKQNLLLADRYRRGSRISRRRRRPSDDSYRRPRDEHRHRRCHGSRVEAPGDAARAGAVRALLDSYEIERRQVGDRNVGASRYASLGRRKWRSQYRPDIRDATAEGQATRDNLARVADVEQRKTNEMIGAELGYRYVGSPVIWDEPGGPEHLFREYVPTTWPGARLPHMWLEDGTPMQDAIGDRIHAACGWADRRPTCQALERAMRARNAPFEILTVDDTVARDVYGLRSDPAPAGHARRVARQRGTRRSGRPGRAGHRKLSIHTMTLKIDTFNHIFPKPFFERLQAVAVNKGAIKRWLNIPFLYDVDVRFRMLEEFGDDYRQVLSLSAPPIETINPDRQITLDLATLANDSMADLVRLYPDRFPGLHRVAAAEPSRRKRRRARARRSSRSDAIGVQVFSNVNGIPLDDPRFLPLFDAADRLQCPIFLHPARGADVRRLRVGEQVEIRDLVDLRLALRDERGDAAARVLPPVRSPARHPDRRPSSRRDDSLLRGPGGIRPRPVRRAHGRRGLRGAAPVDAQAPVRLLQDVLGETRPSSAAGRRPSAGSASSAPTRWSSPPMRRSIRRAARSTSARR